MAYNWIRLQRLISRFGKAVTFSKLVSADFDETTGLPVNQYKTYTIYASIQPTKKKGAIGGENEIFAVAEDSGTWEQGAFILYTTNALPLDEYDEVENLTLNGRNYGNAFIDRFQDWSDNNGIYKARVLLKSIYPTRTDWENQETTP